MSLKPTENTNPAVVASAGAPGAGSNPATVAPAASGDAPKTRPPLDAAKRASVAKKRAVTALADKLKKASTVDEAWALADKLRGKAPEQKAQAGAAGTAEGAQAPSTVAGVPTSAVAAATPMMLDVWSRAEASAAGTAFEFPKRREVTLETRVEDGKGGFNIEQRTETIDPVATLAKGTAPLAAKLTAGATESATGLALVTVLMVLGPGLLTVGAQLAGAWWKARKEAAAQSPAPNNVVELAKRA